MTQDNLYSEEPEDREEHIIPDLRPKGFTEYVGQKQVVETLQIAVRAAKKREDVLDHVLLYGPPGLGKTTMAHIISNELGVPLVHTSGPALEKGGDLISILTHMQYGQVLFSVVVEIIGNDRRRIISGNRNRRLCRKRPGSVVRQDLERLIYFGIGRWRSLDQLRSS